MEITASGAFPTHFRLPDISTYAIGLCVSIHLALYVIPSILRNVECHFSRIARMEYVSFFKMLLVFELLKSIIFTIRISLV